MSKFTKFLALSLLFAGSTVALASCGGNEEVPPVDEGQQTPPDEGGDQPTETSIPYTIKVKAESGKPLKDFIVTVTKEGDSSFKKQMTTNARGEAIFNLEPDIYDVAIIATDGFDLAQRKFKTDTLGTEINATASTHLIDYATPEVGFQYTNGAPMYDFTVTTTAGETWNLASKLEQYDLILLNFWYRDCYWCNQEFPLLEEAYKTYGDKICVLGINYQDTSSEIVQYATSMGLTFDMCYDENAELTTLYYLTGFPGTAFIDKYATMDYLEGGAITSQTEWNNKIEGYLSPDYKPEYKQGENDGVEIDRVEPTTTMPSSDAISSLIDKNINITYSNYFSKTNPDEEKYNWPWVIDDAEGAIKASNNGVNSSYSIINLKASLKKNEVLTFDYKCSTETDGDIFYVLSEGKVLLETSGVDSKYQTYNLFVAPYDGEFEFSLCYYKNQSNYDGDDTVYVKNVQIVSVSDISREMYILRDAAFGQPNVLENKYDEYANVVFNEEDGYYHVETANGPLLLASLIAETKFSNDSVYLYAIGEDQFSINGTKTKGVELNGVDYAPTLLRYVSYANNSIEHGYVPVTEELYQALNALTTLKSDNVYAEQWLEICVYMDAYGGATPLTDPTIGLMPTNCYKAEVGKVNTGSNYMPITPRGYLYEFIPTQTGAYKIQGLGTSMTEGYIQTKDQALNAATNGNQTLAKNEEYLRYFSSAESVLVDPTTGKEYHDENFIIYVHLEQGQTYYIRPYYWDLYQFDDISFTIEYLGETATAINRTSPQWFTTDGNDLDSGNLISTGISYMLGSDGFYYEKKSNGTQGSKIYADFEMMTLIDLKDALAKGGFDFTKDQNNSPLFNKLGQLIDADGNVLTDAQGNPLLKDETYVDETANVLAELERIKALGGYCDDVNDPHYGMYQVTETLRGYLQRIVEKYSFKNVEHSWLKVCYYDMEI